MRSIVLLIVGLAVVATAMDKPETVINTTSMDMKQKQVVILKLLNYITEPCIYKDLVELGMNYNIEENIDQYTKTDVAKKFVNMVKTGILPRGEVFTKNLDRQLKEVVTAFHMLYYAKDFETFLKTACWMRIYLNEGMFAYALTVAVRHRDDCQGIFLPPPYEIYPYFFVRADVIQKAYLLKMKGGLVDPKLSDFYGIKKIDKHNIYIIDENVYDNRVYLNEEDRLRYFTEDIDLNTYYYYFHVDYPFWMKETTMDKFKVRRFELTLYMYQQILARYYLERLSNGLGSIEELSWTKPIKKGYWPWMTLHNGVQMPVRFNNAPVDENEYGIVRLAKQYESVITEAILKGYVEVNGMRLELNKYQDTETLGQLIYGNVDTDLSKSHVDSYRYLLIVMKAALGLSIFESDAYFVNPSILDQYQTALRDPVFYQMQKRLIDLVTLFKMRLPSYTKEELYFPGVKIESIDLDKLVTYFDDYMMDITNALPLNQEESKKTKPDIVFFARKRRLNHEQFKVTLDISSDKSVDSVVRIFLGPKQEYLGRIVDLNNNRLNFVELDSFLYKLNTGQNTIVRSSYNMHNLVGDRTMTHYLLQKLESASAFSDIMTKEVKNFQTGFPTRLLLPKGTVGGMQMMLYVIVTPLKSVDNVDVSLLQRQGKDFSIDYRSTVLLDKMPLGFPLDREIDLTNFFTPNMKFVNVTIFHKNQECDMKTRWNHWVLKNYDMVERIPVDSNSYYPNSP